MSEKNRKLPEARIVLGIFLAVAALQIPADLIMGRLSAGWGILINEILFILAAPVIILKLSGYDIPSLTPLRRMGAQKLVVAVCITIGSAVLIGYLQDASWRIIEIPEYLLRLQAKPMEVHSWEDFYLKLLLLGLLAPICEEFLFRGIIQTSLSRSLGNGKAIVLTAVFFTLIHSATFQPHLYLTLGLLLSWIYAATGSLRIAIICHAINNTWVLANQIHGVSFPLGKTFGAADAALIIFSAVIVVAGVAWMRGVMGKRGRSAST